MRGGWGTGDLPACAPFGRPAGTAQPQPCLSAPKRSDPAPERAASSGAAGCVRFGLAAHGRYARIALRRIATFRPAAGYVLGPAVMVAEVFAPVSITVARRASHLAYSRCDLGHVWFAGNARRCAAVSAGRSGTTALGLRAGGWGRCLWYNVRDVQACEAGRRPQEVAGAAGREPGRRRCRVGAAARRPRVRLRRHPRARAGP